MDIIRVDVYKITQWKDGCVFKTKKLKSIWVPLNGTKTDIEIAKHHGGDILANTKDYKFGHKSINEYGIEL